MEYVIGSQVVLLIMVVFMYAKMCKVIDKLNNAKKQIDDTDDALFWKEDSNHNIQSIVQEIDKLKEKQNKDYDCLGERLEEVEDQIDKTDDFLFADDGFVNEMEELSNAFDDTEEVLFNPENGIDVRLETFENCLEYNCHRVDKIKKQHKKENKNAKKADEKDNKESKNCTQKRK